MRYIKTVILTSLLTLLIGRGTALQAANAVVEASIDSIMLWVGQQTQIHVGVTCDAGQRVDFPLFSDTIMKGLEIIPPVKTDTQYIDRKKRMTVTRHYTVTSFDSAYYLIPPFTVYVDSVPYVSNGVLGLATDLFDVSGRDLDAIFGPKENMSLKLEWQDVRSMLLFFVLCVASGIMAWFLLLRYRDNKPIIRRLRIAPKIPAHQKAIQEMERIRVEKLAHSENVKEYYTELTDVIRCYLNERFGFNATEMTSQEIIDCLEGEQGAGNIEELKELLSTADLVKFAKFKPLLNENDQNLINAMEYVELTKIEVDPESLKEKEEVVVEQPRSKSARIALLASSILLIMVGVASIVLLIREVIFVFF